MIGRAARIGIFCVGLIVIGLLIRWLAIFTIAPPPPPSAAPSAPPTFCIAVLAAVFVIIRMRRGAFFGFAASARISARISASISASISPGASARIIVLRFVILTLQLAGWLFSR